MVPHAQNPISARDRSRVVPGLFACPYCRAHVHPQVLPDGAKVCPSCRNTGQAQPPGAAPVVPSRPQPPGAVASLVCGILGIVTTFLGLPLGIVALVMANNAQRHMAAAPGAYDGATVVQAGRICGIVSIVVGGLTLLFFVVGGLLSSGWSL